MRLIGAGVICYSRRDGEVQVLLGKEKETPGWWLGSNKWSGFSGRVYAAESTCTAAAREFCEESLCVVPLGPSEGCTDVVGKGEVEVALKKVVPIENVVQGRTETCKHVTFLVPVSFADYPGRFSRVRHTLLEIEDVFRQYNKLKKSCMENVSRILLPGSAVSPLLTVRDVRILDERSVEVEVWCERDESKSFHIFTMPPAVMTDLTALYASWRVIVRFVEERLPGLAHPAVRIQKVRDTVTSAFVDKAYMEKSELRWWSAKELREAAENKSKYKSTFRPYFLEFLHTLLYALERSGTAVAQPSLPGKTACAAAPLSYPLAAKTRTRQKSARSLDVDALCVSNDGRQPQTGDLTRHTCSGYLATP
jgi:hypothetical protein